MVPANRSVCPAAVVTTAGAPASPVLVPACCQADQVPPDSSVTDSVPLRLTQATSSSAPPVLNGTGELAQPPPIAVHGVQLVLAFAAVCLAVRTVPAEVVTKTPTAPPGSRTAAGSPLTLPGEPVPIAPPHSQSFGSPVCCQACTTVPLRLTAASVSAPSASEVTAGLLTRSRGESPTVLVADQLVLPIGCW